MQVISGDTRGFLARAGIAPGRGALPAVAGLYLLAYWGLDWISFIFPAKTFDITPWNPPVAASFVLVFLMGCRWAPMLFLAAFSSNLVVRHLAAPLPITLIVDLAEAIIYTAAASAMRRFSVDPDLNSLRDVLVFIAIAVAAPALMAG